MDASAKIGSVCELLAYLPRASTLALLSPFPWQWFDTKGSTGAMRTLAGLEMLLFYLLLPAIAVGFSRLLQPAREPGCYLVGYVLFGLLVVSLVVANLGTLYRLRLQFLLPLLVIAAAGDPPRTMRRIARRLRSVWSRLRLAWRTPRPAAGEPREPELAATHPSA